MATARYIRLFANGNTLNSGTHLVEVEVYTSDSTNVALGKSVTSSPSITYGSLAAMTDGVTASSGWNGLANPAGMTNVVDLGQEYNIVEVRVYRYGADSRSYYQDTVEISTDGTTYTTVGGPQTQQYAGDGAYWSVTMAAATASAGTYTGISTGNLAGTVQLTDPGEYTLTVTTEFTGEVRLWGAAGGGLNGGQGGFTTGTYTFSPGTYKVWVGGGGRVNTNNSNGAVGGFGGGGFAGATNSASHYSSSGGGLSGIFSGSVSQANAIAIAGGGGGAGSFVLGSNGAAGGAGGGATGGTGGNAGNGGGGRGGTQSGGGAVGAISSGGQGNSGSALQGGNGASTLTTKYTGAGGGGGYFGGGSGGGNNYTGGGGGGGSGYASTGFTTGAFDDTDPYYISPAGTSGPGSSAQEAASDGLVVIVVDNSGASGDDSYQIFGLTPVFAQDFGGEASAGPTYETINVTSTTNLTVLGNGTTEISDVYKSSGSAAWDGSMRGTDGFTAPVTVEFYKNAAATDNSSAYAMISWNSDPTTNDSYTDLDYALYLYAANDAVIYHNGSNLGAQGAWDPSIKNYLVYTADGYFKFYNGSNLIYSVAYDPGTVYLDTAINRLDQTYASFKEIKIMKAEWNGTDYV